MKNMDMKKISVLIMAILIIAFIGWLGFNYISQEQVIPTPTPETTPEPPPEPVIVSERQIAHKVLTPIEAYDLIKANEGNPGFVILDVRTPEEFDEERIENAINIDYYMDERTNYTKSFRDELDKLDKEKTYLVYCLADIRSRTTLEMMEHLGFQEVYDMSGGIVLWKAENLPTVE
jgi:rhodanese-related sulfurtransferase